MSTSADCTSAFWLSLNTFREYNRKSEGLSRRQVCKSVMLNLQKDIVGGSSSNAFGTRGAFIINWWIIDMLPPPCLNRHTGTQKHSGSYTYPSGSPFAGQLTQSEVVCPTCKHILDLMFSDGRKQQFNTVCSWLFHESLKNCNLPLPQLKPHPHHRTDPKGVWTACTHPVYAWLLCIGSFKVRKTGDSEHRFHFLMSTGKFQVCGFLSSKL